MNQASDRSHRFKIARGWPGSGQTQAQYAAQHGISPRTLRAWLARYSPGKPHAARAKQVIERAISELESLLMELEAEQAAPPDRCPTTVDFAEPSLDSSTASPPEEAVSDCHPDCRPNAAGFAPPEMRTPRKYGRFFADLDSHQPTS